jgi:Predicted membrane protein
MGLLTWIVVGAIAGFVAGKVVKGSGLGLVRDIVLGVVGALLGGWLAGRIFNVNNPISGFNLTTLVVAFLGAVIVLLVFRALKKR